jgi:uncharacterized membrane protein YphA (DoxX/SURF4 family)
MSLPLLMRVCRYRRFDIFRSKPAEECWLRPAAVRTFAAMTNPSDVAIARAPHAAGGPVAPRAVLAMLRVYVGIVFLVAVTPKLMAQPSFTPRMVGFLQHVAMSDGHAFYQQFLSSVVLPHAAVVATLVQVGELFVGLALLTGTATRLAALCAMFLTCNYMLAKGMWFWMPASNDAAFFFISLALLLSAAGRTFGVDRRLVARWPGVPLW